MAESARMRIIVLDACRNNPFTASMQRTVRNRAIGRGLAAVEPEGETLVVYAAKAGATAADGEDGNSPFAAALAKRLPEPGLEISLLFRAVRDDVLAKTGRTQEPFTYGSLSGQAFYFRPAAPLASRPRPKATQQEATTSNAESESLFWRGVLDVGSEAGFRSYITKYPNGQFVALAYGNIKKLVQPTGGHGYVGVVTTDVNDATGEALGISPAQGELVQRVAPGSPADAAGIAPGDVLTKINVSAITPAVSLGSIASNLLIGSTASIEFIRDGRQLRTTVKISDSPNYADNSANRHDAYQISSKDIPTSKGYHVKPWGLSLVLLDANFSQKLKLGQSEGLYMVVSVDKSGNGDATGLVPGDIIMAINNKLGRSLEDIETMIKAAHRLKRSTMMIRVKRLNKNPLHVPIGSK
jgi:hypothetical protein